MPPTGPPPNETLIRGGPILTLDPAHPTAGAVVLRGDRIIAVGDASLVAAHPDATVHDLEGRTLVPGFIDAHCHLSIAALRPMWGDLSEARTLDDLRTAVRAEAARHPEAEWVRLEGWDEVTTGLALDGRDLDAVEPERPVLVVHHTYHQGVVNGAGLDRLGIGASEATAVDVVGRDEHGRPSGLLLERAFGRAHSTSMAAYADPDRWADHIVARARWLRSLGITAVHDAACDPATEAVYRRLATAGRLPVSVLMMPHPSPFLTHDFGDRLDGPPTGDGDEWLRVGPLKFFADGGAMPALDVHLDGHHVTFGYRHPDLATALPAAVERGFRVGVHAMGNVGIADTLAAFREAARRRPDDDHRFRVEHAGLASPDLARRVAELGAVGVVQPGFVDHVGESTAGFAPDGATWLPFALLADAGVVLAGSSDDPCGPVAPLTAIRAGISRCTHAGRPFGPGQSLPFADWLAAYTRGAAFAGGQEHERGRIAPGLRADLVVLDGDLTGPPVGHPGSPDGGPRVVETWVAGSVTA